MSKTRSELGKLLFGHPVSDLSGNTAPEIMDQCESAAEAILAAGYRKSHTITNIDEASDLHAYSVVKDAHDDCYLKQEDGWLAFGSTGQFLTPGWFYPMEVLWEPEA